MNDGHGSPGEAAPTPEQSLALHDAFWKYCEAEPWEYLANEDLLVVEDPAGRYQGYCVVLGDGDMVYGLGVYLGDVGLSNYLSTISSLAARRRWSGSCRSAPCWLTAKNWSPRNERP